MSRVLNFRSESVDSILSGAQRHTVRPAGDYRKGDVVKAMVRRRPAFAELRIERVHRRRLDELTERHAAQDGQPSADVLRRTLSKLYPGQEEFEVIAFSVVSGDGGLGG